MEENQQGEQQEMEQAIQPIVEMGVLHHSDRPRYGPCPHHRGADRGTSAAASHQQEHEV